MATKEQNSLPLEGETFIYIGQLVAVFYIYIPIFIFIIGWLRTPLAVLASVTTAILLINFYRSISSHKNSGVGKFPDRVKLQIGLIYIASLFLLATLGVGGIAGQTADWDKHNTILQTLIVEDWPVVLKFDNSRYILSYYLAYYLPAAVIGKLFGWTAANIFLLAYTAAGLSAVAMMVGGITRANCFLALAFIFIFTGFDLLGSWSIFLVTGEARFDDWWAHAFQYTSNIIQLFYVPHVAVAGWIMAGLFVISSRRSMISGYALAIVPLSLFWSPFLALGIAPIAGFMVLVEIKNAVQKKTMSKYWSKEFLINSICALLLGTIFLAYFYARLQAPESHTIDGEYQQFSRIITRFTFPNKLAVYLIFAFLEVGVWTALIIAINKRFNFEILSTSILLPAVVFLFLLPLLPPFGFYNDLALKASIPALFVLSIYALESLIIGRKKFTCIPVMSILLILSVATVGVSTYNMVLIRPNYGDRSLYMLKSDRVKNLQELHADIARRSKLNFASQYLGYEDSFFGRHFARKKYEASSESE